MSALSRSAEAWAPTLRYVTWASTICTVLLVFCAVHEIGYAYNHPHRYGPAVIVAVASLAGAVVAVCVGVVAYVLANPKS